MRKLLLVAGARPNFMKIAPIIREVKQNWGDRLKPVLAHTGQHYDYLMSQAFFDELGIPEPDHHLGVGSGSQAEQTAAALVGLERVCREESPDLVVVVGDVNSTLAGALAAKKLGIAVAHVEAGLRSRDMSMPEEINRMVTDSVADILFASEPAGKANLLAEGRPEGAVHLVGNVMIDTLMAELAKPLPEPEQKPSGPYAVLTMHRPANVDQKAGLVGIMAALGRISSELPIVFPAHPRTRKAMRGFGLELPAGLRVCDPLPYREFLALWKDAELVLTDSGGLQEETTALEVPCFTLRDNTERPVTLVEGSNTLVGSGGEGLPKAWADFMARGSKKGACPALWDGRAAGRIAPILAA